MIIIVYYSILYLITVQVVSIVVLQSCGHHVTDLNDHGIVNTLSLSLSK